MSEAGDRGHLYWVLFEGEFNDQNVCTDVTGFFMDSEEPWGTSEWVAGTATRDMFELADDYFVRYGENAKRRLDHARIKFTGHYDDEWILQEVSVGYDTMIDDDRISITDILDEDIELPLSRSAEKWLEEIGRLNSLQ